MVQVRPEGPKAHSPGQWTQAVRPGLRASALSGRAADRSSVLTPLSSKAFVLAPLTPQLL